MWRNRSQIVCLSVSCSPLDGCGQSPASLDSRASRRNAKPESTTERALDQIVESPLPYSCAFPGHRLGKLSIKWIHGRKSGKTGNTEARFIDGLRTGVEFTSNAGKLSHFAPSSKTGMTRCKMCSLNRRMSEHTGTLLYKSLIRRNL